MRSKFLSVLAATALTSLSPAHAAVTAVDFAGLDGNVGNPLTIDGMTFTNAGFNVVAAETLCASLAADNAFNCSNDLTVDFAGTASDISFTFRFNNTLTPGSDIGDVQIFSGATLLGIVDILVLDAFSGTQDLVSLTGFSNVTSIVLSSIDYGGIGYDDFTATIAAGNAVPEPASWAMMIGGFALAGGMMRRRVRAMAFG